MPESHGKPEESSDVVTTSELFQVIGELYVRNIKLGRQLDYYKSLSSALHERRGDSEGERP